MNVHAAHRDRSSGAHVLKLALLLCIAAVSAAAAPVPAAEPALRASDWKAIKQVIAAQRAALLKGDGKKAFGYATPALRAQFGDADTFMSMVRLGYAPLLSARYTEFFDGEVIDGLVMQPLRLIDGDNTVRLALYTLEKQPDGGWRISGCRIGASSVQAA